MEFAVVAILLYFLALCLAILDIFIPSGGILILLACSAAVGSILFAFRSSSGMGQIMLLVVLGTIPLLTVILIKLWPKTPIGRRIILQQPSASRRDEQASDDPRKKLIGQVVRTEHALMPSGEVKAGGKRYPAIAEAGIIDAGEKVEIVAVRDFVLVVRPTRKPLTETSEPLPQASAAAGDATAELDDVDTLLQTPIEELGLEDLEDGTPGEHQ